MSADHRHASSHLDRLLRSRSQEQLTAQLAPKRTGLPPKVPGGAHLSAETLESRWQLLSLDAQHRENLLDTQTREQREQYQHNVENFIGTVKVPVGLAGPLRVNGLFAHGDYYVPLATSEAALVASYNRGSQLLSEAGGCTAALLNEGVSRAPGFAFASLREAGLFVLWAT